MYEAAVGRLAVAGNEIFFSNEGNDKPRLKIYLNKKKKIKRTRWRDTTAVICIVTYAGFIVVCVCVASC